ncbi:MAG: L-threonylcarbamoyladenylate synthase [Acidimicrobiales bacterium]
MTPSMDLDQALEALAQGQVVAVPTDTVYGVAASLNRPEAIAALFSLKRRPTTVALPVLVASLEQIEALGVQWPERARRLAEAMWPGPLTIVVAVPERVAELVGATSPTAGFRIPDDVGLRDILARSGPLCVTSANSHGDVPCQNAQQVRAAFEGSPLLAGVVDGGDRAGTVSTVVQLDASSWRILRAGAIDAREISAILDEDGAATH